MRATFALTLIALAALAGCAATDQQKIAQTALTPLSDLNIVNTPIPEPIVQAQQAPYKPASEAACEALLADIKALDTVLGPDIDAPHDEANPSLVQLGGAAVTGAAQRTVEDAIPFRGWIRKLSGAERRSQQLSAAIVAGAIRRAYLKGVVHAKGC